MERAGRKIVMMTKKWPNHKIDLLGTMVEKCLIPKEYGRISRRLYRASATNELLCDD